MSKKLIETERIKEEKPISSDYFGGWMGGRGMWPGSLLVGATEPVVIDEETFQYAYKCKHCGHEWLEKHEEEHKES